MSFHILVFNQLNNYMPRPYDRDSIMIFESLTKSNLTVKQPIKTRDNPIHVDPKWTGTDSAEVNKMRSGKRKFLEEDPGRDTGKFEITLTLKNHDGSVFKEESFPVSGTTAVWRKYDDLINIISDKE